MSPVENPFDPEQYRQLLTDLRSVIADRSRREAELADESGELGEGMLDTVEQALLARLNEYQQRVASENEQYAEAYAACEHERDATSGKIRSTYAENSHRFRQTFADEEQRNAAKYQENCWLVSSILDDDSEGNPKRQLERLQGEISRTRDQLAEKLTNLEELTAAAIALIQRRRQVFEEEGDAEPESIPKNREDAMQEFTLAGQQTQLAYQKLVKQWLPRLFVGWWPMIPIVLLCAGIALPVWWLVDPTLLGLNGIQSLEWLGICASVGVLLGILGTWSLHRLAAWQTARGMTALGQGLSNARWCQQAWLQYAREELQHFEAKYRSEHLPAAERQRRSLEQFAITRDQKLQELQTQLERDLAHESQVQTEGLQQAALTFQQTVAELDRQHQQVLANLQAKHEQDREEIVRRYQLRDQMRATRQKNQWGTLVEQWQQGVSQFQHVAGAFFELGGQLFPNWDELLRPNWKPDGQVRPGIRIGDYLVNLKQLPGGIPDDPRLQVTPTVYPLPAVLPFPEGPGMVLNCRNDGRKEGVQLLRLALLRLLAHITPGNVRLTILDPMGLGENFAAFMHLADFDDQLITSRIWTEPAHIEQQLANLTEHMENVFQKYLRNDFATIEEYNAHAGEVAEPYRILVVANFPAGFSERSIQRLMSIMANGPRCGVHTLVSRDLAIGTNRGTDLSQLDEAPTVLYWEQGRFEDHRIGPEPLPLKMDPLPEATETVQFIRRIGELSKDMRRVEVPFHRIVPAPNAYWTSDSRSQIDCPLGRAGATHLQHLKLGKGTSQHVLVAGKTGSGKSTLLHILVTNLALRYSPDEVEFYLIDFKKGVEFKTYATHHLPHARVISIESDREFGVSVLERLDSLLEERGQLFRKASVQDIAAYREANPESHMPRILLIVDEFQEFFVDDDRYSQSAALLLDRLVRQGRAFGIHVLLGSQTLGGAYSLARTTIGQMSVRIALQCSEADAHLILSEENSAARLLSRPGEAIYNDANGLIEGNHPFQIAWMNDQDRDVLLEQIENRVNQSGRTWTAPIVFEGNVPADPERNSELMAVLKEGVAVQSERPARVWLGDSVAITGPTELSFARRSGTNLLIVGQDSDAALGILANLVGTLVRSVAGREQVVVCSGSAGSEYRDRWSRWLSLFGPHIREGNADSIDTIVDEFAREVARRQEAGGNFTDQYLVIDDLSRFRSLRRSQDDFGFGSFDREKKVTPSEQIVAILRDGPAVGIHVIIWCDSYNNVDRWIARQVLREFESRVVFQMSSGDSSNLIDSPVAARLGTNRALLYSDERGTVQKFRPYAPPSDQWIQTVRNLLPKTASDGAVTPEDFQQFVVS